MQIGMTRSRKVFIVFNYIILIIAGLICLLPFINLLAISLSSPIAVESGAVKLWPIDFTTKSYEFVVNNARFVKAMLISLERVVIGLAVNMLLTVLTAYPLSKEKSDFGARGFYVYYFLITILFSGGLIPTYIVIQKLGLVNSIWALILPGALPVFNMIVILNFFRGLPKEIEEAAFIDGANHWDTLFRIYVPLSKPSIATVSLFVIVNHWNAWFDGMLYMNRTDLYPLQSYLQTIIINPENFFRTAMYSGGDAQSILNFISVRTTKSAQMFVASLPVLIAYPFLQRYFTAGLVMGSVKG